MSYNNGNDRNSSSHRNSGKYIPRENHDDRRRDDRREEPRRDDRRDDSHPSICIPRTFRTIRGDQTKRAVFNTFRDLRIGHIERIDTVHKTDQRGEHYCTVYVHLRWNMSSQLARETRQKLLDGNDIKVVYDEPWFWKCTMSNMEKPDDRVHKPHTTSRPRIDLGDGVRALSRDPRSEDRDGEESEHHNQSQLCNMDPEDGRDN